jgi:hypothetical protein
MDSQPARKPAGRPGFFTKKPALRQAGPALSKARRPGLNLSKLARPGRFRTLDYQQAESQDIQIASSQLRHSLSLTCQWISKSQQQLLIKLGWMESLLDIVA